jgi:hypothetical protein
MYYAIYVYYYTYDITWYAAYGWVWTAVEADLGVICASAPALKVFFRRYFNLSANRSGRAGYGYSGGSNAKRSAKSDLESSIGASRVGASTPVPLDRIKVSSRMDVTISNRNDRDEIASHHSNDSTMNLTALPSPPTPAYSDDPHSPTFVLGCRTVCAAFRPHSRNASHSSEYVEHAGSPMARR